MEKIIKNINMNKNLFLKGFFVSRFKLFTRLTDVFAHPLKGYPQRNALIFYYLFFCFQENEFFSVFCSQKAFSMVQNLWQIYDTAVSNMFFAYDIILTPFMKYFIFFLIILLDIACMRFLLWFFSACYTYFKK